MDTSATYNWSLSKQDTAVLKGIAIVAMLCHHLYGSIPAWVQPYDGVLAFLGVLGKVCVAIFLFCSGYGLSAQYAREYDCQSTFVSRVRYALRFLGKRFLKFYANYWFIFLIFVPLSVIVFARPLSAAYGEHVNIFKHLFFDLLGLQGWQSYNVTWWFNKLIILIYLLFPLVYFLSKRVWWLMLLMALAAVFVVQYVPLVYLPELCIYLLPFAIGVLWQQNQSELSRPFLWCQTHPIAFVVLSCLLLVIVVLFRMSDIIPSFSGVQVDGLLSFAVLLCWLSIRNHVRYTPRILAFLGLHSMNIYMIHT